MSNLEKFKNLLASILLRFEYAEAQALLRFVAKFGNDNMITKIFVMCIVGTYSLMCKVLGVSPDLPEGFEL